MARGAGERRRARADGGGVREPDAAWRSAPDYLDGAGDSYHVSGRAWRNGHRMRRGELAGRRRRGLRAVRRGGPVSARGVRRGRRVRRAVLLLFRGRRSRLPAAAPRPPLPLRARRPSFDTSSSALTGYRSNFAVYHGERNAVWTFFKDMPGPLLWLYLPQHLALNIAALLFYPWRGPGQGRAEGEARRAARASDRAQAAAIGAGRAPGRTCGRCAARCAAASPSPTFRVTPFKGTRGRETARPSQSLTGRNAIGSRDMSIVADKTVSPPAHALTVPHRPAWLFSVLLDALLGRRRVPRLVLAAFRRRTAADISSGGLVDDAAGCRRRRSWRSLAVRAYAPRPRASWLSGSWPARARHRRVRGPRRDRPGLPGCLAHGIRRRRAAVFDAAVGWRGAGCWERGRAREASTRARSDDLVDRGGGDDARRRADGPLSLPRAAEDARPQGPQAEVPRLGVRLSCGRWSTRC